jgi:hypothetical protein
MDKSDEQVEADTVRRIVQIRVVMSRHGLSFEQAAAVLQLSALQEILHCVVEAALYWPDAACETLLSKRFCERRCSACDCRSWVTHSSAEVLPQRLPSRARRALSARGPTAARRGEPRRASSKGKTSKIVRPISSRQATV